MRIDELKRIAKENDYKLNKSLEHYKLTHKHYNNYITINGVYKNRLWISIPFFCDEKDFKMIKAAVEFAETPPEDREEKKKFYLKHRYLRSVGGSVQYFTIHTSFKFSLLKSRIFSSKTKQQFTREEIDEIKEKFNTYLADFEEVEVRDEDED